MLPRNHQFAAEEEDEVVLEGEELLHRYSWAASRYEKELHPLAQSRVLGSERTQKERQELRSSINSTSSLVGKASKHRFCC